MFKKFFSLSIWVFLLVTGQALAQQASYVSNSTVTMETDGTNPDGSVNLQTNNAGRINFFTNRTLRGYIDGTTGALTGFALASPTFTTLTGTATQSAIQTDTSDAADSKMLTLSGAGGLGNTRGGYIRLGGNENALIGGVDIVTGNVASSILGLNAYNATGVIRFLTGNALRWEVSSTGNLTQDATNGGDIVFGKDFSSLRQNTADGADNNQTAITGGGAYGVVRGATLYLGGNEQSGTSYDNGGAALAGGVNGGTVTISGYGDVAVRTGISGPGEALSWTFDTDGSDTDLVGDATRGGNIVFSRGNVGIFKSADSGTGDLYINGGNSTSGLSPRIIVGSGDTGQITLISGSNAAAGVILRSNSDFTIADRNGNTRWSFTSTGNLSQDGTNGASIVLTKASTGIQLPTTTGITAAGTTVADATQLTAVYNNITTVAAGTGVKMWNVGTSMIFVRNGGANALNVYGVDASATINGGGAGSPVSVAVGATVAMVRVAANTWIAFEAPAA
jgi:hypothetical protein